FSGPSPTTWPPFRWPPPASSAPWSLQGRCRSHQCSWLPTRYGCTGSPATARQRSQLS
ncbi:uncharacterized protein METZ01_LOCUS106544, partial [marine metagenome]